MFQKYTDALNLMDATIAKKDDARSATDAWDNLYAFVHANFVCPHSALTDGQFVYETKHQVEFDAEVQEMIVMFTKNRETLEEELRKIPPVIAEVAFPVYIARHLLRDHRVPVYPSKSTTFTEFHNRYGYMIINACK